MKKPSKDELLKDVLSNATWNEIAKKYGYSDSRYLRKLSNKYELPKRRKILKPTKIQLQDMIDKGMTVYQISDELGYSSQNGWRNIYTYLNKYNIEFDFKPNKELRELKFSNIQKSLIYGTMLGDGYLRSKKNGAVSLALSHSITQKEYLEWKKDILKPFIIMEKPYIRDNTKLSKKQTWLLSYNTISHPFLRKLKDMLYLNNIKTVTREYLDLIDDFALSVWICDDGSLNKQYKYYRLATQSFSYNENLIIQEWLNNKYNIKTSVLKDGKKQYYISFSREGSRILSQIIKPYIPISMKYKILN